MTPTRRTFMRMAGVGALAGTMAVGLRAQGSARPRFRAIAFDAFAIVDPRPIAALAEQLFPGRGAALSEVWRSRQFEYTWLRSLSQRYADFWRVTEDALVFAAGSLGLALDSSARQRLMDAYLDLHAWPDVLPAVTELHAAGVQLALLSNFTPAMLSAAISGSPLQPFFRHLLSTDRAQTFKPDPRAYALGLDAFRLRREEILFVPFAGWDAAGAGWFGYPTFWVNRLQSAPEELGVSVEGSGPDLSALLRFVLA